MAPHRANRGRWRTPRYLLAAVVAVLLIASPSLAEAAFTDSAPAATSYRTLQVGRPAEATTTSRCRTAQRALTVTISSVDTVERATGYVVTLAPPAGSAVTQQYSGTGSLDVTATRQRAPGSWTLTVRAQVGSWTGPALTSTYTC